MARSGGGGGTGGRGGYNEVLPPSLLQNQRVSSSTSSSSSSRDGFFISGSSPSSFLGSRSILSFEDVRGGNGSKRPFYQSFDNDENGEDDLDDYFHQPEKKRRLTADQIQFLEKSFEVENKLEPERKAQLAKDLGLQPRQVAIWFQNRRARWKTKQLEKDFESLQDKYNSMKADYDTLLKERDELKSEVLALNEKLLLKATEGSEFSITSSLGPPDPIAGTSSDDELQLKSSIFGYKQDDLYSVKSDILDSDSPHCTDGGRAYFFEPDQSDLSQDEEDNLSRTLIPPPHIFPKLENIDYLDQPASSCNFGSTPEDHAFWSWAY